jgi:uncharacterized protein (TIGR03437 family)
MALVRFVGLILAVLPVFGATFGNAVPLIGGASDLVLDEPRTRLYLVNTNANRIEIYSTSQRRYLTPVTTDRQPVAAAMSRDGRFLYVTSFTSSSVNVIDLNTMQVRTRVPLPASPEGVAVGLDGRVVITTIGNGPQNQNDTLVVYDPSGMSGRNVFSVAVPPPPPTPPTLPPPSQRIFLAYRGRLASSRDGRFIIGINNTATPMTPRVLFVYEVASASVLRSRSVANISNVVSVSPDGSKFMAGLHLFDTQTLTVLAHQDAANAPFFFPAQQQFNMQENQGGSVFSPDGSILYSAFNFAPTQVPPARPNVSRLLLNDPDNLLIQMGLQLPENLIGKMAITNSGDTIYALSESGFVIIPISTMRQNPIAVPASTAVLLANDQCGAVADQRSISVPIDNKGGGARFTVSAQPFAGTPVPNPPRVQILQTPSGPMAGFGFNPSAAQALGTVQPHDILVQSPEAINIPPNVRVYQNNRDTVARGSIIPIVTSAAPSEGLVDVVADYARDRLYVANSGMNRVEVFDMRRQALLDPIKVGQMPRSMALGTDGATLYVANSGSESISIVDLEKARVTGRVRFPAIPMNAAFQPVTPTVIANTQHGLQIVMSNGTANFTLWRVVGNEAVPRRLNPAIFGNNATTVAGGMPPVMNMAATPEGEYVLLFSGTGNAYLYSSLVDDFVAGRLVFPTMQGYVGPITAGPRGQYFAINGTLLNQALTVIGSGSGPAPSPGLPGPQPTTRSVAAVASAGFSTYARFAQIVGNPNIPSADPALVEVVNTNTGQPLRVAAALEGTLATVTGNQRLATNGRTMAVDSSVSNAFVLTTSGLSAVPLTPLPDTGLPSVNPNGAVSTASYLPNVAPGGLVSVFGQNMAQNATASTTPLPLILGNSCVTLNNQPLPLVVTSPTQINAQIPTSLAPGRYPVVVRSLDQKTASQEVTLTVSKYAPAIFVDENGQPAIFHLDGRPVSKRAPAKRDERVVVYATGLGVTRGGLVTDGNPSPARPLAVTDKVDAFFGIPGIKEAAMIVEWSGLAPGYIGLYQINVRVPGAHVRGEALPAVIRIGGVSSPMTGPAVPRGAVD